jgi:hypothetical protein
VMTEDLSGSCVLLSALTGTLADEGASLCKTLLSHNAIVPAACAD